MKTEESNARLIMFAMHVEEMRNLQIAYFASKKANRYADKKLLAASKAQEQQVDGMTKEILLVEDPDVPVPDENTVKSLSTIATGRPALSTIH